MYLADVNVYTYTKLADNAKEKRDADTYQKIARRWLENSNWWLRTAKRNSFFTFCCFWSIALGVVAFGLALKFPKLYWLVLLVIAWFVLISVFILQHYIIKNDEAEKSKLPWYSQKIDACLKLKHLRLLAPPERNKEVEELIKSHEYLEEVCDIAKV